MPASSATVQSCPTAPPPIQEIATASVAHWNPTPRLRELIRASHKAATLPEILALIGRHDALCRRDDTRIAWRDDQAEKLRQVERRLLRKLTAARSTSPQEIAAKLQVAIDRSDLKEAYPLERLTINLLRSIRRELKASASQAAASGDDAALIQAIARFDASDAAIAAWQADEGVSNDSAIVEAFDVAALAVAGIAPTTLAGLKAKAAVLPKLLVRFAARFTQPNDGDFDDQADVHERFAMALARDVMAMGGAVPATASNRADPDIELIRLAAAHRASEAAFSAAVDAAPCDPHPGAAEADETERLVETMTAIPAAGPLGIAAKAGVVCASIRLVCGGSISFAEEALASSLADDLARLMPAVVGSLSDIGYPAPAPAVAPVPAPPWSKTVTMTRDELLASLPSLQSLPDLLAAARANYALGWSKDDDGDTLSEIDDALYARLAAHRCQSADQMAQKMEVLIFRLLEAQGGPGGSICRGDHALLRSLLRDLRGDGRGMTLPQPVPCPLADMARKNIALEEASDAVEGERGRPNRDAELSALWGRQDALEQNASWMEARSIEGALFAILMAGKTIRHLNEVKLPKADRPEVVLKATRFLYSALGGIEAASGISAEVVGAELFMSAHLNQLRLVRGH